MPTPKKQPREKKSAEQKRQAATERMRKSRQNADNKKPPREKKSAEQKRQAATERMRKSRQNADNKKPQREKKSAEQKTKEASDRKKKSRQNADNRAKENQANSKRQKESLLDPINREVHQKVDAACHRTAMQVPARKEAHRKANAECQRKAMEVPVLKEAHRKVDADLHLLRRQDEILRTPEKLKDAQARAIARQNEEHRTPEKVKDAQARAIARQNEEHRTPEKVKDAQARAIARQNEEHRTPEKVKDAQARAIARQNEEHRTPEKVKDAAAKMEVRKNLQKRLAENITKAEHQRKKKKLNCSHYEYNLEQFNQKIRCAPEYICYCCGGLFYKEGTDPVTEETLRQYGCPDDLINTALHLFQETHRLCKTCKNTVKKKKVPRLCLSNGLDFPDIPTELKGLSALEERLVALRLPFMQIRLLGTERQSVLRGNVVNVENDIDVCAKSLPLKFNETSTVQVQIMRMMKYKSPYMYETIRPQKVYRAAQYLLNSSELYENVALSTDWSLYEDEQTMNFICEENEDEVHSVEENIQEDLEISSENNINATENDRQDLHNLGAEETLYFREDDLNFSGIRIAPCEGKTPIPLHRDYNAEVLSFPTIYCGQPRKIKENVKLSYTDIAKSELRRYDRRACHPTKVLYSFKRSFNEKVYQAVQVVMRKKVGTSRVTAGSIRTPGYIENLIKKDEGYAVFKNLRSSPSYWKEKQKTVLAMIRTEGKCVFFVTLSAAEAKWPELLVMLMKIVKNKLITEEEAAALPYPEKQELIRSDPVTCMRHFDHRFRALLTTLFKTEGGIFAPYELADFFCRYEYQLRGSPHVHGIYWIKDAPMYVEGDTKSEEACIKFIDKFITCARCEEGEMENLIGYQLHKCTHTCKKKVHLGEKCRFGFPKPPMETTRILQPLSTDYDQNLRKAAKLLYARIQNELIKMGRGFKEEILYEKFLKSLDITHSEYIIAVRSSIKRTTVFLRRPTNAIFINPYNRLLLEAWKANIDIQFVLDTYACAKYCVGYITKSEGGVSGLLRAATEDARRGNKTVEEKLKKFATILINGSEISSQEAAGFLLGIGNTNCSRQDIFINTGLPDERIGFLKSKEELEELNEDSEDVCVQGIIGHYTQRPVELEDLCLAEFASMYTFCKRKKAAAADEEVDDVVQTKASKKKLQLLDSSGYVTRRIQPKIIRFRHYGKIADPENYHREQLAATGSRGRNSILSPLSLHAIHGKGKSNLALFVMLRLFGFERFLAYLCKCSWMVKEEHK